MSETVTASDQAGGGRHRSRELTAWQGVGAELPGGWSIVQASGGTDEGYVRSDGPDEMTVELRWKRTRRQPSLEVVAEQYLKQVRKASRKLKVEYEGALAGGRRVPREKPSDLRFEWLADRQGHGRLIWCRECRRTVIAQVSGPRGEATRAVAEQILPRVRDHSDGESVEWGVYGLEFRVPKGLRLIRQRLMSGFLSLNFYGPPGRVIVERWGLAEMLLEGGFLAWHDKEYLSELKRFGGETTAVEWGEHEALVTEGREGGFRRVRALVKAFLLPGRAERFASIVWHCPDSNRVVGVRAFGRSPLELARSVAETVRCH